MADLIFVAIILLSSVGIRWVGTHVWYHWWACYFFLPHFVENVSVVVAWWRIILPLAKSWNCSTFIRLTLQNGGKGLISCFRQKLLQMLPHKLDNWGILCLFCSQAYIYWTAHIHKYVCISYIKDSAANENVMSS